MEQSSIQKNLMTKILTYFKSIKGIIRAIVVCVFAVIFIITVILSAILSVYLFAGPHRSAVGLYSFVCFCIAFGSILSIVFEILDLNYTKPYLLYIVLYDVVGYSIAVLFVFCSAVASTLYAALLTFNDTTPTIVTAIAAVIMWGSLALLIGALVYFSLLLMRLFKSGTATTTTTTDATPAPV